VDGYLSSEAHTMICDSPYSKSNPATGPQADAICAAYFASELVGKMLKPGTKNSDILGVITQTAKCFGCVPVEGGAVCLTKRFVSCSPQKVIEVEYDDLMKVKPVEQEWFVLPDEQYTINIRMVPGNDGRTKVSTSLPITIYQRDVMQPDYQLRFKSSRSVFSHISATHSVFPFSVSSWDPQLRAGLNECCFSAELIQQHPPIEAKQIVAQFKYCVWVNSNDTIVRSPTTGLKLDYVRSEYQLSDPLMQMMEEPQPALITANQDAMEE
jgi:hypothetical protein